MFHNVSNHAVFEWWQVAWVIATSWGAIWNAINESLFKGAKLNPLSIFERIKNLLCLPTSDKLKIRDVQLHKDLRFGETIIIKKKDVEQVFSDATFNRGWHGNAIFDYLLWFTGSIICTGDIRGEGVASSKEAEKRAILVALIKAKQRGMKRVHFLSDANEVIRTIKGAVGYF